MLLAALAALAVEGMWEPSQLPSMGAPLRAAGFLDDPALLADLHGNPLGSIVSLGGCTASFVSDEGLLITNHHCAVGHLQRAQREGEDLVKTGFYAGSRAEERSGGAGSRVWVTQSFQDVTAAVLAKVKASTPDRERNDRIETATKKLVADCERAGGLRCRVASYYEGLRYTLVRQVELRDLRVVMAPPDMVGNYGDEIDNWHWPRHSGDFAFLRAYVGRDGKPADYSPENIPFAPARRLTVSGRGPSPGEFVMVAGYPGRTERWRTAAEVEREASWRLPQVVEHGDWTLAMLARRIEHDPAAATTLNVPRFSLSNGVFNAKGTLEAFGRTGVVGDAKARDAALRAWIAADPARKARYDAALDELVAVLASHEATRERDVLMGWLGRTDLLSTARGLYRWSTERRLPDAAREPGYQSRDEDRYRARLHDMQASLNLGGDREFMEHFLRLILKLPADQQPVELLDWLLWRPPGCLTREGGTEALIQAGLDRLFADPALATAEARQRIFALGAAQIEASNDGFLSLAVALRPYDDAREAEAKADAGAFARLRPLYAEALRTHDPGRAYPDANGTLRVTFGTVQGYSPRDAITYAPQTTVHGIVEKAGPWPYEAPPALLQAIAAGKWGPWADPRLGTVPVDYLTDLDVTGGNSGSPTLDAKGRLVGLAFDGNVEGIASDWVFDPLLARTIHVDVRYILWYLDAVLGADALVREMGLEPSI